MTDHPQPVATKVFTSNINRETTFNETTLGVHHDEHEKPEFRVTAPCSIPLTIANAFDYMVENGVHTLVVDGVEIRRTR